MSGLKAPQHYDKVFKDECIYTFDTPFSEAGLAVNLRTWQGVAADMIDLDLQRSGGKGGLYLMQKFRREEKVKPTDAAPEPTKMAIGVEGGFMDDKWEIIKEYSLLAISPSGERSILPYPNQELPMLVSDVCEAIEKHQGAKSQEAVSQWEEEVVESKYYKDLVQLPATKKISPSPKDWKCEKSGDTQNLWLNLSDGYIGGGRRHWDGSGGSNGALEHFEEEKAKGNFFPLVVKLGTITPAGADVYSYAPDEDNLVKDPLLAQHLEHWGIDVMKMEKTDKTLAEMQVDLNLNYDWSRICESGDKPLVRLRGPGLVGLKNLGQSCYMNSSVQLLLGLPEVKQRYLDDDLQIRKTGPSEVQNDLISQVAKLANGLNGHRYAPPLKDGEDEEDPKHLIAPQMFRTLIGRGHAEFSSSRQQDAAEFIQYFLEQLARAERSALGSRVHGDRPTSGMFDFAVEERWQESTGSRRVKYSRVQQNMLGVPVKLEDADNLAEVTAYKAAHEKEEKDPKKLKTEGVEEEPKPLIQLSTCLARFGAPEEGVEFRGSAASKTTRIATMPRYLLVQMQRYFVDEKWCPAKLDCKVPMPETLNLEHLRGKGLQAGEEEMPEEPDAGATAPTVAAAPEADEMIVAQLLSMGIGENAAKRASLAVNNSGAEAACAWFFEHSEDPDINLPPTAGYAGGTAAAAEGFDPEAVSMLCSMGFAEGHVHAALKSCMNSVERAADWLFSHADDLDAAVAAVNGSSNATPSEPKVDNEDGVGEYELMGFVSHIGKHTSHGHYVCHMRRGEGGSWVIFDDSKVAKSEAPPLELGYLYLYRRDRKSVV